jgi:EAL domain-containing protein (putative c-di-GMP-specific phosphodiesterase class I)
MSGISDVTSFREPLENEAIVETLLAEGCGEGQGFAFGAAVSAEEMLRLVSAPPERRVRA